MTFANMRKAIDERGITQRQITESMDMSENNFSLKVNERIPMTVEEAKFFQRTWLKDNTLDYLLESDGNVPTEREKERASLDALGEIVRECDTTGELTEAYEEVRAEVLEGQEREALA